MSGTIEGGLKTRQTNIAKYGEDYYRRIGKLGGRASSGGPLKGNPELARKIGKLGGRPRKETFFVQDQEIDNHIIEPFNKQPWYKGWIKRSN